MARMLHTGSFLLLSGALLTGCAQSPEHTAVNAPSGVPATSDTTASHHSSYTGIIPCADCPGIDTQLDLLSDGRFFLSETYMERDTHPRVRMGYWAREGDRLLLKSDEQTLVFHATDDSGWLMSDIEGRPIQSQLNYTLRYQGWQPRPLHTELTGMLTYWADAALFIDCATGHRYPVQLADNWIDVERSYLSSRAADGAYLHTVLDATLEWTQPEEGFTDYHLRVQGLKQTTPAMTCGVSVDRIEHHQWQLVELPEQDLSDLPPESRPHLTLGAERLSGFSGCNVMMGSATLEGQQLTLGPVATTMMYCMNTAALEQTLLKQLEQVVYTSLDGPYWRWYDENMVLLLTFRRAHSDT